MLNDRVRIAAELRELRHKTYYNEEIVDNIVESISVADPTNTFREPEDVYELLADIIDPTCHNKQIEINKMAPLEFRTDNLICSNCGETFCADPDGINAPIDWAYCPSCGYRIVETNSGEDNNSER